ncbi:LpxI family protein [Loktanella sp. S4079]|uniref:LpxI family protein n=1 Tax=Loktanella sp. S4079 TaxID=579483 RepID=UPI0005FA856A|nr:UDP-2,3-diacylglucosamine diphosphatase LpxI [Loktanella sp. S4079]KJZ20111.1 phosphatidate cytidylyltransferase [Loktanella sp. S4079]
MLALIAGTGDLPPALVARLPERPLICAMRGFEPSIAPDITFRMEHLGSFLATLKSRGVTQICMAGAVRRPQIDPAQIDAATMPLVPKVQAALTQGDDGALRIIITILEEHGFEVMAAHDVARDLLPRAGVLTKKGPASSHTVDAFTGEACVAEMGQADTGQACVIRDGQVALREDANGTDAMLGRVVGDGGVLFKAPKPNQDRRADLPLIGPATAKAAKGLDGIVIEAGGVMVLDLPAVRRILDAQGMFLWVRPRGGA